MKILCDRVITKQSLIYNVTNILDMKLYSNLRIEIKDCLTKCDENDDERLNGLLSQNSKNMKPFEEALEEQGDRTPEVTASSYYGEDFDSSHGAGGGGGGGEGEGEGIVVPWKGWMGKPKLQWLLSPQWHEVDPLHNIYESPIEYGETLLRLWVLLTFQWGAGAVYPKCTSKGGGGKGKGAGGKGGGSGKGGKGGGTQSSENLNCGKPLLSICHHGKCRSHGCNNEATWKCHHPGHDSVCSSCMKRHQNQLCGLPGTGASTDIYDAVVDQELVRHEGTVYHLSHLESRKPPKIAPNWRTSYRLKMKAFVAIVKLVSTGEMLTPQHDIQWGVVECMDARGDSRDEFKNRERGKMCIRILTKSDCESLVGEADSPLNVGVRIAIIDMRVFVPEVISVLNTFAKPTFLDEMNSIPFIKSLIGKHEKKTSQLLNNMGAAAVEDSDDEEDSDNDILSHPPPPRHPSHRSILHAAIQDAILDSDIPFLKSLQRQHKMDLVNKLCAVPAIQSLSGTQLDAFAAALASSVHCCQGPPGTGKSYLGVCLVLALSIIKAEIQKEKRTQMGPIVVLSYKNHSLDEFLGDILENRKQSASSCLHSLRPGQLIRSGNPESEILKQFSERKRPEEHIAEKELTKRINCLRKARLIAMEWRECSNHLDSSFGSSTQWKPHKLLLKNNNSAENNGNDGDNNNNNGSQTSYTTGVVFSSILFLSDVLTNINKVKQANNGGGGGDTTQNVIEDEDHEIKLPLDCKAGESFVLRKHGIKYDCKVPKGAIPGKTFIVKLPRYPPPPSQSFQDDYDDDSSSCYDSEELNLEEVSPEENSYNLIFDLDPYSMKPSPIILSKLNKLLSNHLSKDAEHWGHRLNTTNQTKFHMDEFISGSVPPPRCQMIDNNDNNTQCMNCASFPSIYCSELHVCKAIDCIKARNPHSVHCDDHQCAYIDSKNNHLKTCPKQLYQNSQYCSQHSCVGCMISNQPMINMIDPIACSIHVCKLNDCKKMAIFPHDYCEHHCCEECISLGQTPIQPKISPKVKNNGGGSGDIHSYCKLHVCAIKGCYNKKHNEENCEVCVGHLCVTCSHHDNFNSVDINFPTSHLCSIHKCSDDGCSFPRLNNNNTLFCSSHSCQVCVNKNIFCDSKAIEDYPRNVCQKHPLCTGVTKRGDLCPNPCQADGMYCEDHSKPREKVKNNKNNNTAIVGGVGGDDDDDVGGDGVCWGKTKKKKRCEKKGVHPTNKKLKFYCKAHYNQRKIVQTNESKKAVDDVGAAEDNNEMSDDDEEDDENDNTNSALVINDIDRQARDNLQQTFSIMEQTLFHSNEHQNKPKYQLIKCKKCDVVSYEAVHKTEWLCPLHETKKSPKSKANSQTYSNVSGGGGVSVEDVSIKPLSREELTMLPKHPMKKVSKKIVRDIRAAAEVEEEEDSANLPQLVDEGEYEDAGAYGQSLDEQVMVEEYDELLQSTDMDMSEEEQMKKATKLSLFSSALDQFRAQLNMGQNDKKEQEEVSNNTIMNDDQKGKGEDEEADSDIDHDDNIQTLRDIIDVDRQRGDSSDDDEDEEEDDEDLDDYVDLDEFEGEDVKSYQQIEKILNEISKWTWKMNVESRLKSIIKILRSASYHLKHLRNKSYGHIDVARQNFLQTKGVAYRQAEIIGATVVGASIRLEAIRAAEPFAIVVEEACEVMEPTLMSVLAVKSLQKLELVGDHRQLPAFVQDYWYDLAMDQPSIKTSLFERLVMGGDTGYGKKSGHYKDEISERLECTILDEQRRMRSEIADLTRPDYEDVVIIKDHVCCDTQLVGDRYLKYLASKIPQNKWKSKPSSSSLSSLSLNESSESLKFKQLRQLWGSKGREIPCTPTSIYFWNLKGNTESRPLAGLSSCNSMEAEAVTGLCKWFIQCGIPKSAITIITPYKGQKTAIMKLLQKAKLTEKPIFNHQNQNNKPNNKYNDKRSSNRSTGLPDFNDITVVSTVDRYQGDENDIVILSLVKAKPGNKFVALPNRFVVATSRARLGFFIVGSTEAVTNTSRGNTSLAHWQRCVDHLCQPCASGETIIKNNQSKHSGLNTNESSPSSRIGHSFPICCPIHRDETQLFISKENKIDFPSMDQWSSFCKVPCTTLLEKCGHPCSLTCHYNQPDKHNVKCKKKVDRPCHIHADIPLICGDIDFIRSNIHEQVQRAIERDFKCEIMETLSRTECSHMVDITCHEKELVLSEQAILNDCVEKVSDYIHPSCNHVFNNMICHEKRKFEMNPPKCNKIVNKSLACGHSVKLKCYELNEDSNLLKRLCQTCKVDVTPPRPRCLHRFSTRCSISEIISNKFDASDGQSAKLMPSSARETLVEYGVGYGPSETDLMNEFNHSVFSFGIATRDNIPQCNTSVSYKRSCGHIETDISCHQAFLYAEDETDIHPCEELTETKCPFCRGDIKVPCQYVNDIEHFDPYEETDGGGITLSTDEYGLLLIDERMFNDINESLKLISNNIIKKLSKQCNSFISLKRLCGDIIQIKCSKFISYITKKELVSKCVVMKPKNLLCGHLIQVKCCDKNKSSNNFTCREVITDQYCYPCGIHTTNPGTCTQLTQLKNKNPSCPEIVDAKLNRCGHQIKVPCMEKRIAESSVLASDKLQVYNNNNNDNDDNINDINKGRLNHLVDPHGHYSPDNEYTNKCHEKVSYKMFHCGHIIHDIECYKAFQWSHDPTLEHKCFNKVNLNHPICGHEFITDCYLNDFISTWLPWDDINEPNPYYSSPHEHHNSIPKIYEEPSIIDSNGNAQMSVCLNEYDSPKPIITDRSLFNLCKCNKKINYHFNTCDHILKNVSCSDAFLGNINKCQEIIIQTCEGGLHDNKIKCSDYMNHLKTGINFQCQHICMKKCHICLINDVEVPCYQKRDIECSSIVTTKLSCGHEVNWVCGSYIDPREDGYYCRSCLQPQFSSAIDFKANDKIKKDFIAKIFNKLNQNIIDLNLKDVKMKQYDLNDLKSTNFEKHMKTRSQILSISQDLLNNVSIEDVKPPPINIDEDTDLKHYKYVFYKPGNDNETDTKKASVKAGFSKNEHFNPFFQFKQTKYGRGVTFYDLNKNILSKVCKLGLSESNINIIVGIAFYHKSVEDAPQFAEKLGQKGQKKANKTAEDSKQNGFDAIREISYDADRMLYWYPDSVLPLAYLTANVLETCLCCYGLEPISKGYTCTNQHFICYECLTSYIESNIKSTDSDRRIDPLSKELKCIEGSCIECYSIDKVIKNKSNSDGDDDSSNDDTIKVITDSLMKLHSTLISEQQVKVAIENERTRLQAEFDKIQSIKNANERNAHILRLEIINDILTLRCPRCKLAFIDFSGCFALSCSTCPCGFCAWCLKDCDGDAHAHVLTCPENHSGDYHGTFKQFEKHHDDRKTRLIDDKLKEAERTQNPYVAAITLKLLQTDIQGTDVSPTYKPSVTDDDIANNSTGGGGGGESNEKWKIKPLIDDKRNHLKIYKLDYNYNSVDVSRETSELNICGGHFCRLVKQNQSIIKFIEVIEYDQSSIVRKQYDDRKKANPNSKEIWVFHGTNPHNIPKIIENGFKVGGQEVGIVNGAAHGSGVYTATGPNTPMGYSQGGGIILSKGLLCTSQDHSTPVHDYVIFKNADQLLPYCVVYT